MVVSIFRGGLGNQLFQIAAGYALARRHKDIYCINPKFQEGLGQGFGISKYLNTLYKNIDKTDVQVDATFEKHNQRQFRYYPITYSGNLALYGYFQTEKFFINMREDINNLFGFKYTPANTDLELEKICVIHIRTGDFLQSSEFDVVTPSYFEKAIAYVNSVYKNVIFKVISDDEKLSQRYLPKSLIYSFISSDEIADLNSLAQADIAVISNSSFSWWGTYFGKEKVVIAPDRWFNNDSDHEDIYRSDMLKIAV